MPSLHEPNSPTTHEVVIVGGGPTGLLLAVELSLAGVQVALVERRATQEIPGLRAGGLHARSLEILDQRGVVERFLSRGTLAQLASFARVHFDLHGFPTRHPYVLALPQQQIEEELARWLSEHEITHLRGCEAVSVSQDDSGAEVALSDGRRLRAPYLVGCDGGRSLVRKSAGIDFPGWEASVSYLLAEAEMSAEAPFGFRRGEQGVHAMGKLDGGRVRLVLAESQPKQGEPTLQELHEALLSNYGDTFGLQRVTWLSRFSDMARQAAEYRKGRILLAGDAAHVHSPIGGQGLNTGVQDAVNLGWKLGLVVRGLAPDSLLESYHAERHPVGARVIRDTLVQTALDRSDGRYALLRETVLELLQQEESRRRYAGRMSGLDIHYDLGPGHPLLGRRMPDLDVITPEGTRRVFSWLHRGRPLLLCVASGEALRVEGWSERVQCVQAEYAGPWDVPVLGVVPAPSAVLVRPDGYVAWVGDGSAQGLSEALTAWFGPPRAA